MFKKTEFFRKFVKYYASGKKYSIIVFMFFSLCTGFLEFLGVALVYPFIMLLLFPSNPENIPYIGQFVYLLPKNNYIAYIIGFSALFAFILKNIFIIIVSLLQSKFLNNWSRSVMSFFMEFYLYSSYNGLLKSSHDSKTYILTAVCNRAFFGFVTSLLDLVVNCTILVSIFTLLLIMFPFAAIITILFSLITFTLQNFALKNKISKLSILVDKENKKFNKVCLENILNLKDIKILSAEDVFFKKYNEISDLTLDTNIKFNFFNSLPCYLTEILIIITCIVLAAIISYMQKDNPTATVASYALVAAAIFRIAPIISRVLYAYMGISGNKIYMETLVNEYEKNDMGKIQNINIDKTKSIVIKNYFEFKDVNFSYNQDKQIIKNLSFKINKGDYIGIIGLSGAGKSTLADIIMGILPINSGEIFVDKQKINENNFPCFRKNIGYVPQSPKILDRSFRENIAWGIEEDQIDDTRVIEVLKQAQIYDFINENYKDGIYAEAIIAQNGISQGQKQRLAIARALYRNPDILLLDEATSSLDVEVENEITKILSKIKGDKTIISIAHRLSTLKCCNKLFYMKEGTIVDIGTFDELSQKYPEFKNLVELSSIK